ncbi:MAG TPA: hypothetical protein VFB28_07530 [Terriglobales bacterium]|nr:hypothetical protein [Terriglobales bacterium]
MRFANVSKGMLLGLLLLLATSVFASSNKGSLQTMSDLTVNGKALPAGDYSVQWEGTGSNVQVNILKGKKVIATTPAKLVDLSQAASNDSAVVKNNGDGTKSLAEVRFSGRKYALQMGDESANAEANGASK